MLRFRDETETHKAEPKTRTTSTPTSILALLGPRFIFGMSSGTMGLRCDIVLVVDGFVSVLFGKHLAIVVTCLIDGMNCALETIVKILFGSNCQATGGCHECNT